MFNLAPEAGVLSACPDLGQPPVQAGQQEGNLEGQREERQQEGDLLAPQEDAVVEHQEFVPAVSQGVRGGETETKPAQSGLDHPRNRCLKRMLRTSKGFA